MQIIEDEELEFNILKVEEGYKLIDKEEQENEEPYYFTKAFRSEERRVGKECL